MPKIKTALLAYGMSGKIFHAPFLDLNPNFELVGAWERTTKNIQNDYPNTQSFASIEALLTANIDLVIINTPIDTHFEYAKKALQAGKHILVEKAFTTTLKEALYLQKLAQKLQLQLAVFHNRRWDSDFKTVAQILKSGKLGEIVEAEFHFDRYNPNLNPKPHKETPTIGAGLLKDLGSHLIDQALHLFGMPTAIFADIRHTRHQSQVDDCIDILLIYSSFRVRLKSSFFVRQPIPSYILHGKNGSFLKPRGDLQEAYLKLGLKPNLPNWGTENATEKGLLHTQIGTQITNRKVKSLKGNYMPFFDQLAAALTQNTPLPVTAQEGVNVMKIIELAIKSNTKKRIIKIS